MKKNILLCFLLIIVSQAVFSQSRLIGVMPMQFNPSFAGSTGGPRVALLTGYDYDKRTERSIFEVSYPYKLNKPLLAVSYDNFIEKLSCGVGFYTSLKNETRDVFSFDTVRTKLNGLKSGFILSPKFSIRGKWTIAPSMGLHYKHATFDSGRDRNIATYDVFYLSAGILINTANFYIGYNYNFHPINESYNFKLFYEDYHYYNGPVKLIEQEPQDKIQIGYRYQRRESSKTSYSLQAIVPLNIYKKIKWHNPDISFTVRYKKLLFGANYFTDLPFPELRKEANVAAFIGYQTNHLRVMLSMNVLNLPKQLYPELSMRWTLPNRKGSKRLNFE